MLLRKCLYLHVINDSGDTVVNYVVRRKQRVVQVVERWIFRIRDDSISTTTT